MSFRLTARLLKDINHKRFSDLKQQVKELGDTEVRVGLPGGKIHREVSKDKGKRHAVAKEKSLSETTVAYIGAVHEFGAPEVGIPERPWLRPGIRSGSQDYIRLNRINIIKILRGELAPIMALRQLGAMAQAFVQKYIRNGKFTPLKPETIARKGSSKPLIDTAQMVNSVTYSVEKKGDKS